MLSCLYCFSAAWAVILLAGLWACALATFRHFGRSAFLSQSNFAEKITLIRPIRGLNDGIREALESIAESDIQSRLEILIAMESSDDPAYPIAIGFSQYKANRNVSIILTGPSQDRMGKIHNMIEAFPKAKTPFIVFSDADAWANPALIRETARAFGSGYDAVFALPYFADARNAAEMSFAVALNHGFSTPAALSYYLLNFPFCAGAWMGFSKDIIKKIGGLESFEKRIADDYSLGMAVVKSGGKHAFLSRPVFFRETTKSVKDTFQHLSKWASIIHSCLPNLYWIAPLFSPTHAAFLFLLIAWATHWHVLAALVLFTATILSRILVGIIQDLKISRKTMPFYSYLGIPLFDFIATGIWLSGFRKNINWRNKSYRLSRGCKAEVINAEIPVR